MSGIAIMAGLVLGVVASIAWQEIATPWLRKRKQYKQRVATRRAKTAKKEKQNEPAN